MASGRQELERVNRMCSLDFTADKYVVRSRPQGSSLGSASSLHLSLQLLRGADPGLTVVEVGYYFV